MLEICPLVLGVRLSSCFIRPDRLEKCARLSSPDRNHLRAVQSRGVRSESYSHPSRAGYAVRPRAQRTPRFVGSSAKSSPQRQARILAAEPDRQRPCSPAFALSQQRLGIFSGGNPEFAETAINKSTPPYAANNTFRMGTYKKIGVGVASPSLRENFRSNTKQCTINTYAKHTAKFPRMCTYEKNRVGGHSSLIVFPTLSAQEVGAPQADATSAVKFSRICSCKIIGVKPPLESTLAEKYECGPPAQGPPSR